MHDFSLIMIQVQIVSVSVDVQQSTPIFQPNNVQCILINQIMLFLVDTGHVCKFVHFNITLLCSSTGQLKTNSIIWLINIHCTLLG